MTTFTEHSLAFHEKTNGNTLIDTFPEYAEIKAKQAASHVMFDLKYK